MLLTVLNAYGPAPATVATWSGDGLAAHAPMTTASAGTGDTPFQTISNSGNQISVVASGTRSPRIQMVGGVANTYVEWDYAAQSALLGGTTSGTSYALRFYVTLNTIGSASWALMFGGNGATMQWRIDVAGSASIPPAQLRIRDGAGTQVAATTGSLVAGTLYRIEITVANGLLTLTAYEGDTATVAAGGAISGTITGTTVTSLRFGNFNTSTSAPTMFFDDFALSRTATEIGPVGGAQPPTMQGTVAATATASAGSPTARLIAVAGNVPATGTASAGSPTTRLIAVGGNVPATGIASAGSPTVQPVVQVAAAGVPASAAANVTAPALPVLAGSASATADTTATAAAAIAPPAGMVQWFRADDVSGSTVTTWPDASGNSLDVTQGTATNRPDIVPFAVNGHNAVAFAAASSQSLGRTTAMGTLLNAVPGFTAIAVWSQFGRATGAAQHLYYASTGASASVTRARLAFGATTGAPTPGGRTLDADAFGSATGAAGSAGSLDVFGISTQVVDFSTGNVTAWRDGELVLGPSNVLATAGTTQATTSLAVRVGSLTATSGFLDGAVAELLIYPRTLTTDERRHVHAYLGQKYDIAVVDAGDPPQQGTASASATSTATAAGTVVVRGAVTATATSTATADSTVIARGAGAATGTSAATGTATPVAVGAAAGSGATAATAAAVVVVRGSAGASATTTATVPLPTAFGSVTASAASAATSTSFAVERRTAAATGTATATTTAITVVNGTAAASGASTATVALPTAFGSAAATATSTPNVTALPVLAGTVSASAISTTTVSGVGLTAGSMVAHAATTATASAYPVQVGTVAASATSTATAVAGVIAPENGTAAGSASGGATAAARVVESAAAAGSGSSQSTASTTVVVRAAAAVSGGSAATVAVVRIGVGAAAASATSIVTATATTVSVGQGAAAGSSTSVATAAGAAIPIAAVEATAQSAGTAVVYVVPTVAALGSAASQASAVGLEVALGLATATAVSAATARNLIPGQNPFLTYPRTGVGLPADGLTNPATGVTSPVGTLIYPPTASTRPRQLMN